MLFTRIGHTGDYEAMANHLEGNYPSSYIVAVGFSLGGNIVTKYMGEKDGKRSIIGGISICQGYNAVEYVHFHMTGKKKNYANKTKQSIVLRHGFYFLITEALNFYCIGKTSGDYICM